ncbi:MAG TPA: nucleotidyltransferase domain-containing protein [Allocoleopsis sp.]
MNTIIKNHHTQIIQFCQQYGVKKIELFGSGNTDQFDLETSDLDFLIEFKSMSPVEYSRNFFNLKYALQDLFNRSIDLVEIHTINNPYFLKSINSNRVILYSVNS